MLRFVVYKVEGLGFGVLGVFCLVVYRVEGLGLRVYGVKGASTGCSLQRLLRAYTCRLYLCSKTKPA